MREIPPVLETIQTDSLLGLLAHFRRGSCLFDNDNAPLPLPPLRAGELIDLSGPAGSGKTQLLMHMIILTILPQTWSPPLSKPLAPGIHLNGKASSVLLFDCDLSFSLLALRSLLRAHVLARINASVHNCIPSETSLAALISTALSRLHICRPTSPTELLASLLTVPKTFITNSAPLVPFIVLDGYSTYYWINRFDDLGEGTTKPLPNPHYLQLGHQTSMHRSLIRALKSLKDDYTCGIAVSRSELVARAQDDTAPLRHSDMPWTGVVDRFVHTWKEPGGAIRWKES